MIIILIIAGLGAGFMILSGLSKDKISGGWSSGYTKGTSGGKSSSGGGVSGGAHGGNVKNWASSITKTTLKDKKSFYEKMDSLCSGYDWNKFLPFTMAALETRYAKSCYFHNLFCITTLTTDPDQFFKHESIPDLKFKVYIGFDESVAHFWNLLKLSRYSEAYKNRQNPEQAIIELIKGGYAGKLTDPTRYLNCLNYIRTSYARYFG